MRKIVEADLLNMIKNHKIIFVIIILSLACSFTVFDMMTGVVSFVIKGYENGGRNYTFTLDLNESSLETVEMYDRLHDTGRVRNILLMQAKSDSPLIVGWYGGDNLNQWFVLDEGRFFNADEGNKDVAVVSADFYPALAFEEGKNTFSISDNEFFIVGVGVLPNGVLLCRGTGNEIYERYYPHNSVGYFDHALAKPDTSIDVRRLTAILPAQTFLRHDFTANILRIEYYLQDNEELALVENNLKNMFPHADIVSPVLPERFWQERMNEEALQAILIIGCGMINMVALFTYWLVSYRRTHTIYRMLGADKLFIVCTVMTEWFFLMLIGYVVGFIIKRLFQPVMEALSIYMPLRVWNTVGIFTLLYLGSFLLMLPQLRKNTNIALEVL